MGQLASFSKGRGYTKSDLKESGTPIILYGRLYTDYVTLIEYINTYADEMQNSVISVGGEVIVPSSGESSEDIARASVVGKPGIIIGGDLNVIRPSEQIDPVFLALAISNGTPNRNMAKRAQGKSVVHLHNSDLREVNLVFPKIEEQTKIGSFFKELEKTITLHKRKYEALLKLKEAYLQNMFPAKDESVPKVRFANFDGDWEQRKLGEFAEITMGQSPSSENYTENPDDYILVQGNADIINGWVTPRIWTTQVTKIANVGDIILSVRAPVGDVGRTEYDVVLGRGVAGIRGNDFIFQMLNKMKSNGFWKKYSTGSTFESINSNNLKEAIIFMPWYVNTKLDNFLKVRTFIFDWTLVI